MARRQRDDFPEDGRGLSLEEVREILRLFCKGLTGRNLLVCSTEDLVKKGIGWTLVEKATTDGSFLYLPPRIRESASAQENFEVYKVLSAHQAGHLEFGTFDFSSTEGSTLFPSLLSLLWREKPSAKLATDYERFFDLFSDRTLAADIFTLVEDARVDHLLKREYRGMVRAYRRLQGVFVARRPRLQALPLREVTLEILLRLSTGDSAVFPVPMGLRETMLRAVAILRRVQDPAARVEDTVEATLRLYTLLRPLPNIDLSHWPKEAWLTVDFRELPVFSDESLEMALAAFLAANDGASLALLEDHEHEGEEMRYRTPQWPHFRGELKPELVQSMLRFRGDATSGAGLSLLAQALERLFLKSPEIARAAESPEALAKEAARFVRNLLIELGKTETSQHAAKGRVARGESQSEAGEAPSFLYDEWDFRAHHYRPQWCRLWQRTLEGGSGEFFQETLRNYPGLVAEVKRHFELLKPERLRKIKRLHHGEEFDLDAVVESFVEKRAGQTPSEKVYWRRNKVEREVSLALLLDMSVSTEEKIDQSLHAQTSGGARKGKRIIDLEKESLVFFMEALEIVGDRYGVYGFSGYGKDNVEFFIIKELEEKLSERVKARVDKIAPIHGTRMGPAIRHVIASLEQEESRTRILLLLSDGRPQDRDYGRDPLELQNLARQFAGPLSLMTLDALRLQEIADRREKEYAVHDTRMALLEAREKGIVPFCLSVDKMGHDYLRTMCGDIGYEVVSDVRSLPRRLTSLYRRLTT